MTYVLSGYGRMGKMVEKTLLERGLSCVGASEDIQSFDPHVAAQSICIDFTTPAAFMENYRFLADHFKGVVVGTTGWDTVADQVTAYFQKQGTPLIYAANFSIGVNILYKMTTLLAALTAAFPPYQATLSETHHIHKLDKPSGTAKKLATLVEAQTGTQPPITSFRQGEVPGIHTVAFESPVDALRLTHEAFSREGLAAGAVEAALLCGQVSGVHDFKDLIEEQLNHIILQHTTTRT